MPQENSLGGRVDKKGGLDNNFFPDYKTPRPILSAGQIHSGFPSYGAVRTGQKGGGICIKRTPLKYVAAANPATSPGTPPPRPIIISVLVMPEALRKSYISERVCMFFEASPGSNA